MNKNVIQAIWLTCENFPSWCEYCSSTSHKKTYLPFHKDVLNPQHICENCKDEKEFIVVDWFEFDKDYRLKLNKLKEENL